MCNLRVIHQTKTFTHHRHILVGLAVYGGAFAREEIPMDFSPEGQAAVAFTLVVGKLSLDLVEGFDLDLRGLGDAPRSFVSRQDDIVFPHLWEGFVFDRVDPMEAGGGGLVHDA